MSRKPLVATATVLSSALLVAGVAVPGVASAGQPQVHNVHDSRPMETSAAVELRVSPMPAAKGHTMRVVVRTNPREAGRTIDLRLHEGGKVVTVEQTRTNRDGKAELRIPGRYVTAKGYRFTVTSKGSNAVSFRSNADKRLEGVAAPPPAPRGISVDPGDQALYVSWRPVTGATEYRGVLIQGTTTTYGPWEADTEHAFTGLTNGAVYNAGAQARNAAGEISTTSTDNNFSPTALAPGPVPGLAATVDTGQVTLVWNEAARADEYVIKYKVAGAAFGYLLFSGQPNAAKPYTTTIKGLTDGVKYEFQVYGTNDFGRGAGSTVDATPENNKPQPSPSPVTALTLTPGDANIVANWTVSNSDALNFILYTSTDGQQWTEKQTVAGTARTATLTGLANGQAYWVQIVAVSGTGGSAPKVAGPVYPAGKPSATPNLRANPSDNSIVLDWAPMAGVTKFRIQYRPNGSTTWSPVLYVDAPGLHYVLDALDDEVGYFIQMSAMNGAGIGPAVTLGPIVTTNKVPGQVANANVAASGGGTATLTWDAPATATGYKVEVVRLPSPVNMTPESTTYVAAAGQVTYTVPNLVAGERYRFIVYATNQYGYSRGVTVGPITAQ